jgi:anti-anti-sigma factor
MPGESVLKVSAADGGVTVVGFRNASILDTHTIQTIGDELNALLQSGTHSRVVLDFADVRFLASHALGMLLKLRAKADPAGARVVCAGMRPELAKVFKIANLDRLFVFYPTREQAAVALATA